MPDTFTSALGSVVALSTIAVNVYVLSRPVFSAVRFAVHATKSAIIDAAYLWRTDWMFRAFSILSLLYFMATGCLLVGGSAVYWLYLAK